MQFSAFAVVGVVGFIVDATVFQLLFSAGGGYVLTRLAATSVAVIVTWYLNRRFVFQTHKATDRGVEFAKYLTVQSTGIVINLSVYALMLAFFPALRPVPIIAVAAGASVALIFNFLGARRWAFADTSDNKDEMTHE